MLAPLGILIKNACHGKHKGRRVIRFLFTPPRSRLLDQFLQQTHALEDHPRARMGQMRE